MVANMGLEMGTQQNKLYFIDRVPEFNFLGLIIQENLSWKNHCDKISNSISKSIGILNRLKHILPQDIKLTLYNSMVISHLNYCILAWGYEHNRVNKLQKKVLRIISLMHIQNLYLTRTFL